MSKLELDRYIGEHIKNVRKERGLSQQELSDKCGFSNTTLSAYENGRKIPNLITIANIARQLNVSIERLYYGDDNIAFINTVEDDGRKIVNSLFLLWSKDVVNYFEDYKYMESMGIKGEDDGFFLRIMKHTYPIKRLFNGLNEFRDKKDTYTDPEAYLEMLLSSVALEINKEISRDR